MSTPPPTPAVGGPSNPRPAAQPVAGKPYVSPAIDLRGVGATLSRADLEFEDVDHSGASFEARIFVDNPRADQYTPQTAQYGYAGSFNIFGHGGCFGDVGHCELHERRPYDPRPEHPLTPARRKVVIVTDTVRRLVSAGRTSMTLTIVPVITGGTARCDFVNVLKFKQVSLVAYQ